MKTVTGKITSSSPIPISKAACMLSKFISSDTGASQATNAYLRRASTAFDELARLHSKSDQRKHKKVTSIISQPGFFAVDNVSKKERKDDRIVDEVEEEQIQQDAKIKEEVKKKKKRELDESEGEAVVDKIKEEEKEMKKKKKKMKSRKVKEEEERKDDGSQERQTKKKKRRIETSLCHGVTMLFEPPTGCFSIVLEDLARVFFPRFVM